MAKFLLTTENTCDMPLDLLETMGVGLLSLSCMMNGVVYDAFNELDPHDFFDQMRSGQMPTTSQVNPDQAERFFRDCLREHDVILHLSFSSAMSGTCQSVMIAANTLMAEMPEKKIIVVDTLAASMGQGMMVHYAAKLRDEGKTAEETAAWIEEHKQNFVHVVTVDDLNHLYRGGRVSRTAAVVGTMLSMKPILVITPEGKLVADGKVRGRKKALTELVDRMEALIPGMENEIIMISHGDCLEDVKFVCEEIKSRFGLENFLINPLGATVGAHAGPGTVALFFLGQHR